MTGLPETLEDALNTQGYTIDVADSPAFDIVLPTGTLKIPAAARSKLTWQRATPPALGDDFYLSKLPIFDALYRPVILSNILDQYRTRRLGYNTPGEWRLAFRRWGNLNMPKMNLRYASSAVALPLDNRDETDTTALNGTAGTVIAATSHALDVASDFPQSLISGSGAYASGANDRRGADNSNIDLINHNDGIVKRTGRNVSIMELLAMQRDAFTNIDAEIIDGMAGLFLSTLDRGEGNPYTHYGISPGQPGGGDYSGW